MWLLFKDPLDLEVRYKLLCTPDGNDPNWDFEPSTWISNMSESIARSSDHMTQKIQKMLQAENFIHKEFINDPLTYSDKKSTLRLTPTGLVFAENNARQPQLKPLSQFGLCDAPIDFWNMPQNVFNETHAELADFLFQNPGNFRFTTSFKNDALTLSFQPTPFSSLIDSPNLEPPTPCSPSYSPVLWEESSQASSDSILAPGPSLISAFGTSTTNTNYPSDMLEFNRTYKPGGGQSLSGGEDSCSDTANTYPAPITGPAPTSPSISDPPETGLVAFFLCKGSKESDLGRDMETKVKGFSAAQPVFGEEPAIRDASCPDTMSCLNEPKLAPALSSTSDPPEETIVYMNPSSVQELSVREEGQLEESDMLSSPNTFDLSFTSPIDNDDSTNSSPRLSLIPPITTLQNATYNGRENSPATSTSSSVVSSANLIQTRDYAYSPGHVQDGLLLLATTALDSVKDTGPYVPIIDPNLQNDDASPGRRYNELFNKENRLFKNPETSGTTEGVGTDVGKDEKVQSPSSFKATVLSSTNEPTMPYLSKTSWDDPSGLEDSFDVYFLHPSPAFDGSAYSDSSASIPSSAFLVVPPNSKTKLFENESMPSLMLSCPFVPKPDEPTLSKPNVRDSKGAEGEDVFMHNLTPSPPISTAGTIPYQGLACVDGKAVISFEGLTKTKAEEYLTSENEKYNNYHSVYIPNVVNAIESYCFCQDEIISNDWNIHMFQDGTYPGHPVIPGGVKLPTGGPHSGWTWQEHVRELTDHCAHT
ncbi:hypothetical protein F4604DRAFT_1675877 [Suillus subluteus]|nr:hypothetical protein F4604DRAFT_1675877 [Suillus subluteus]